MTGSDEFERENWDTGISFGLLIKLSCLFAWPDFHIVEFVKSLGFTAELVYWEIVGFPFLFGPQQNS